MYQLKLNLLNNFCLPIKTSKLRTSELSLQFPNFESLEECNILCYSDAAFADLYNDRLQDACAKNYLQRWDNTCPSTKEIKTNSIL